MHFPCAYDENGDVGTATLTSYYFGGAYEVTNGVAKSYYSFSGQTILRDSSGLQYFLTDHLGSVVAITNATGTLTSQQRYLPFGGERKLPNYATTRLTTDLSYTGQRQLDDEIGLMDYKFRMYSPVLGRFISPDNITPDMTQGLNRYSYVRNNPIRFNDPSGHCATDDDDNGCGPNGGGGNNSGSGGCNCGLGEKHPKKPKDDINKPTPTVTPTPCIGPRIECLPTPTNTPYPTSTATPNTGPVLTSPTPPKPHLYISIYVDWSEVDMIDAAIDGIALTGDIVTIGALLLGQAQVALVSEIVGDIVGAVGVVKGGYDLYENHDASGLLSGEFSRAASKTAWRVEGEFPVIGTIGDGINLYRDLNPKITIQWKVP